MDGKNQSDRRNVVDEFKGMPMEKIVSMLDSRRQSLQIAIENLERDFNMGTIVRSANAFNVGAVHIIGSKQWNKRGAMATDKYLNIIHHSSIEEFHDHVKDMHIIGIDNIPGSVKLGSYSLPANAVLVFGSEAKGISENMIRICEQIVAIEQYGSTRSLNVGVAAGVAMYEWLRQNLL